MDIKDRIAVDLMISGNAYLTHKDGKIGRADPARILHNPNGTVKLDGDEVLVAEYHVEHPNSDTVLGESPLRKVLRDIQVEKMLRGEEV